MSTSQDVERAWFLDWSSTVESELALQQELFDDLLLRTVEVEPAVDHAVGRALLRDALRQHPGEWKRAPSLLRAGAPVSEVLPLLFGEDVPQPVALFALGVIAHHAEGPSESLDLTVATEVRKRDAECQDIGESQYIWVVTIERRGKMRVSVSKREDARMPPFGLTRVLDVRQGTRRGRAA